MESNVYRLRETLPQMATGALLGAVPGTLAGAALPAVIGFALLGIVTPHQVTAYFSAYTLIVVLGGLLGAMVGGSMGACRRVERGCPAIAARQVRIAAVVGALLALPLAYALWLLVQLLGTLLF